MMEVILIAAGVCCRFWSNWSTPEGALDEGGTVRVWTSVVRILDRIAFKEDVERNATGDRIALTCANGWIIGILWLETQVAHGHLSRCVEILEGQGIARWRGRIVSEICKIRIC